MNKRTKTLLAVIAALFAVLLFAAGTFATETEGFTFKSGSYYEIRSFMKEGTPSTVEATVYLEDNTVNSGTLFGNFWYTYTSTPSIDFRIIEGGIPRIRIQTGNNKFTNLDFTDVAIETGKFVTVRFVIDRSTEGAHKALCYIDGTLAQTIEAESISTVTSVPQMFVLGGNRNASITSVNTNYFRGKISSLTVWQGTAYPDGTDEPLLKFDYSAEGNTEELIKDQTGNGFDAYYTERFISAEELPERIEDYAYSFAVLGDPQCIAAYHPDMYKPMYEWIIDQNPEYVIGLGDIQDAMSDTSDEAHAQWKVAQEAIFTLDDAGIPHTHIRGNHDYSTIYKEYLPWSRYSYIYDGVSAGSYSNSIINTWRTIELGDTKWLILGLDYNPNSSVIEWAGNVIAEHPEHNVIIASHSYLNRHGNVTNNSNSKKIWTELGDKYENVVMILCGHVYSDNVIVNQKVNSVGTTVTEMLIDYQYLDVYYSDPVAIVTMFHFSEDGKTLQVENYSFANEAYYKMANQFTVTLDVLDVEKSEVKNEGTADYDLATATANGTIDGYTWSLCGDTLVISGTSENTVLSDASAISAYASTVKKIVIENSTLITELGDGLFSGFTACETVVIPAKLNTIGSKTFENMTALTTVALYNDYYSADFAGSNIIDLKEIGYFSADSMNGAAEAEGITVYMPIRAAVSGEAQKLISAASAIYYIYPNGDVADLIRDTADETVTVKYYTVEMTGNPLLTREGTNYQDDGTTAMFNWAFDETNGKLTMTFTGAAASFKATQGFAYWKKVWADAVVSIDVLGSAAYSKIQIWADKTTGPFNGYKNLIRIYFEKGEEGTSNTCNQWQVSGETANFGMFSDNPKLTTIGLGSVTEGVVDLSPMLYPRTYVFRQMFKGCTSITKVILPDATSTSDTTNLYSSTFEGCESLTSVTIPNTFTTIGANSFAGCTALKYLTVPASLVNIDAAAFDTSMTMLTGSLDIYNTIKGYGYNVAIDLRETALADFAIERTDDTVPLQVFLAVGSDVEEYTADALSEKFGKNVTYVVYPSTPAADAVRALAKKDDAVKIAYYSTDLYPELTREGTEDHKNTKYTGPFSWNFDDSTGHLTFMLTDYDLICGSYSVIFPAWKNIWRNEIISISVEGTDQYNKLMNNNVKESIFANMPNLESILFKSDLCYIIQHTGMPSGQGTFSGNPSLTSIAWGDKLNPGVIDLRGLKKVQNSTHHANMFKGCTSIEKVIMPESFQANSGDYINKTLPIIAAGMFGGCTALKEIEIPSYFTTINSSAFSGCTALDYLIIHDAITTVNATAFDNTDTKLICFTDTQVNAVNTAIAEGTTEAVAELYGSLDADGISIRMTGYNGLRYIYSFDNKENEFMENSGYDLKEYGLIFSSAENMAYAEISNNGSGIYETSSEYVKKIAVYDGAANEFVGKILADSTAEQTMFAGTVTHFDATNANLGVYIRAYSVYVDQSGTEYIRYSDYGEKNAEYKTASLFDVTIDMYTNVQSGIREEIVDEAAVWNTLLLGADVAEYKNTAIEGFEGVSLTLVNDGSGNYLAFLRSKEGSVTEAAIETAKAALDGSAYTITDYIGITIP